MSGRLVAIYTASAGGEPLVARAACRAIAGEGLEGDRYAAGRGTFSQREGRGRQVTLIEREAIAAANDAGVVVEAHESRRNLVTEGVDLGRLVGRTFTVGDAVLIGVRDCLPCAYLEGLTRTGVRAALEGRGGLRADVVRDGIVRVGDEIAVAERSSTS